MKFKFTSIVLSALLLFSVYIYPQTTHIVHASNFVFTPDSISIALGDTVRWVWDEGTHTTTSDSTTGADVWDAPLDQTNQSFSYVIHYPGIHRYYCTFHGSAGGNGMAGIITVQLATSVNENIKQPVNFVLDQNYPNPFNPTTKISYAVAKSGLVSVRVYDILGNEIATIVNEKKQPGNYEVNFDGSKLPSGIYIYELQAGNFKIARKMALMK